MRKLVHVRMLMGVSLVLLTLFMLKWLSDRFTQEKSVLRRELVTEFRNAELSMIDTLLKSAMLRPISDLKGVKSITVNSKPSSQGKSNIYLKSKGERADTSNPYMSIIVNSLNEDGKLEKIDSTIHIESSINIKTDSTVAKNDIVEGVKVFVGQVKSRDGNKPESKFAFSTNIDTAILVNNFNNWISQFGLVGNWFKADVTDGEPQETEELIFYSRTLDNSIGVEVTSFSMHIVRKLRANIAVALLIVALMTTALLITYSSLKQQHQLSKIRNDFVGNITHELKTPVATVKVALEALLSYKVIDNRVKAEEYINIATLEVKRLEELIQRVLNMSIHENPSDLVFNEAVNLKELVEGVMNSMSIRLEQQNAKCTFNAKGLHFDITGDLIHIQGVLCGLIDNSLKYSEERPEIELNLTEGDSSISLEISDNGIGIPSEYTTKVFDKFFRVPTGNRHNVKGYGLGLSYAASVMKQLGGSISVFNNPHSGCTFKLVFPKK